MFPLLFIKKTGPVRKTEGKEEEEEQKTEEEGQKETQEKAGEQ